MKTYFPTKDNSIETLFVELFNAEITYEYNPNIDLMVLTGGTDINSRIYNQAPDVHTDEPDTIRDIKELVAVANCRRDLVPIVGICRGAQLLCAMNGGHLIQHNEEHLYGHYIQSDNNDIVFKYGLSELFMADANHHQIMVPSSDCKVLYRADDDAPEVALSRNGMELMWQPHPEWESIYNEHVDTFKFVVNKLITKELT